MIPVVIIAYNQLTYIRNMVYQCLPITEKIYIIDNASIYQPLINWYKNEIPQFKSVELIYNSKNEGHNVWKKYTDRFPNEYVVTDPDLLFNPEMPSNVVSILSDIGKRFNSNIVGLALDVSDHQNFTYAKFGGQSIYDIERKYWLNKIQHETEDIYVASIDTTFALRSKSRSSGSLRVAGKFTCKHIPWYRDEKSPLSISIEENAAYLQNNISTHCNQMKP